MTDLDVATADGQDRYVPTPTRDIMSAGHEGVYEWIAENLVSEGMRALDFGCGTGYGAALMASAGATVDGVDQSPTAIGYATENFGGPRVRFFVADLVKPLPDVFAPRSYDLVASSEVLEHVVDPFAFVGAMADALNDDGVCFVGTPNRLWSIDHVPDGNLLARSHLMEFTPPALIALLCTVFDEVNLMVRIFPDGSMFTDTAPPMPVEPTPRARHQRSQLFGVPASLLRKVASGVVERLKRGIEPEQLVAPATPAVPAAAPRAWLSTDIVWARADDPAAKMDQAVGLAAVCHKPRRAR